MWLSTLPRRFGIILEKILDRYERSGIAVQWNRGVKVIPSRILLVRFRLSGDSVECNHGGFKPYCVQVALKLLSHESY